MDLKLKIFDFFLKQPSLVVVSILVFCTVLVTLWVTIMFFNALGYQPDIDEYRPTMKSIKTIDAASISNRNFFGTPDNTKEIEIEQLPETKLELTLAGVFQSNSYSSGSAIIIDNNQESNFYSVGDELPGKVVLKSVNSDSIVLDRNGVFETLYFENTDDNPSGSRSISTFLKKSPEQAKEDLRKRIQDLKDKKREKKEQTKNQFN